jgi:hypothetical protein
MKPSDDDTRMDDQLERGFGDLLGRDMDNAREGAPLSDLDLDDACTSRAAKEWDELRATSGAHEVRPPPMPYTHTSAKRSLQRQAAWLEQRLHMTEHAFTNMAVRTRAARIWVVSALAWH